MFRALWGLGLLWASQALAIEAPRPSFDCAAAQSQVELAICDSFILASHDRRLAQLYSTVQHGWWREEAVQEAARIDLLQSQRAWLAKRELCPLVDAHEHAVCLVDLYEDRLLELAQQFEFGNDLPPMSGVYGASGEFYEARVVLVRTGYAEAYLQVSAVMGPTYHVCEYRGDGKLDASLGIFPQAGDWYDARAHGIALAYAAETQSIQLLATNQNPYCGARAHMDGSFTRLPD